MTLHEFLDQLKMMGIYRVKMSGYVDTINIYVKDQMAYKVMLHLNPDTLKKAKKKVGLDQEYVIHSLKHNQYKICMEDKFKQGNYIIIWDLHKGTFNVYEGESSEIDQLNNIKRLVSCCNS